MGLNEIEERLKISLSWRLCFMFLFLHFMVEANEVYYDFILKETNFTRLCSTKSMLTVNESFPGPTIRIHKEDIVYVNVYNKGNYGLTLHWHGVKQPRNPWFDGPEYITQCGIPPGTNFTYQVIFSSEEGTLWWHAHSDWTRATVHGPIVILPAPGTTFPYPEPDGEQIIVLASWYKEDVMELMNEALHEGGNATLSDAFTINGQPGDFCNCSRGSTFRMMVDYGETYLLRIINSVQNIGFFFAIADHNLTVVGNDATYTKPLTTSYIMITPGQTMDVLVTANQSPGHYYMVGSPFYDGEAEDFDKSQTSAILAYRGNYTPPAIPTYPSTIPDYYNIGASLYYTTRLRSLASVAHPIDVPISIDTRMYIAISMNTIKCPNSSCTGPNGDRLASSLNNISFDNPSLDVLQAYYRNISGYYQTDFPDQPPNYYNFTAEVLLSDNVTMSNLGTRVKVLDYNETIEIVFQGTSVLNGSQTHPMHIHGFRFYVVGWGVGNFDNETDPLTYNLVDPVEVNTVPVPKDGWAAIRFKASNPGVWYMHCHFDKHMSWGMDTVFIVKNGGTEETSVLSPPDYMPTCHPDSLLSLMQPAMFQKDGQVMVTSTQ